MRILELEQKLARTRVELDEIKRVIAVAKDKEATNGRDGPNNRIQRPHDNLWIVSREERHLEWVIYICENEIDLLTMNQSEFRQQSMRTESLPVKDVSQIMDLFERKWSTEGVMVVDGINDDIDGELLCIPHCLLQRLERNVDRLKSDLILYNRDNCRQQFHFIMKDVIEGGNDGYIIGQRRSGKSCITFLAALSLRKDWDIVWFNAMRSVVFIKGNSVRSEWLDEEDALKFMEMLRGCDSKTLLILNDVDSRDINNKEFTAKSIEWRRNQAENRRLIICAAESVGCVSKCHTSPFKDFTVFAVGGWSLGDYLKAVENDKFWAYIKDTFPAGDEQNRSSLVEYKYFYAGTCAKFMFQNTQEDIMRELRFSEDRFPRSGIALLRFTKFVFTTWSSLGETRTQFAGLGCRFMTKGLAERCKPELIRALYYTIANEDLEGSAWVFEAYFCALIKAREQLRFTPVLGTNVHGSIDWTDGNKYDARLFELDTSEIKLMYAPYSTISSGMWLYSMEPAGYDAFMLLSNGTIRFVKTAVGPSTHIRMDSFTRLVMKMREKGYELENAEIYIIVPNDGFANHFHMGSITGWQDFVALFRSWPQESEYDVMKRLQVFALDI